MDHWLKPHIWFEDTIHSYLKIISFSAYGRHIPPLSFLFWTNTSGHPNTSRAHGEGDAIGFQRTSNDPHALYRESTRINANDKGNVWPSWKWTTLDFLDSRNVAEPLNGLLFPLEEAGSAENPIAIDENDVFFETMTPRARQKPPAMESWPAVRSIEKYQNSCADRQLFNR